MDVSHAMDTSAFMEENIWKASFLPLTTCPLAIGCFLQMNIRNYYPLIVAFSSESNDHVVEKLISEEMQKKHLSHVYFLNFGLD